MRTLTPFSWSPTAQDDEPSPAADNSTTAAETIVSEPFFTGADTALWVGFGAFILVFILVLLAIIRGRVIKPAERKARASNFFEPAGADADITFEEPAEEEPVAKKGKKKKRNRKREYEETDVIDVEPEEVAPEIIEVAEPAPVEEEPEAEKPRAPFANLFSRRKADREETKPLEEVPLQEDDDLAEVTIEQTVQEPAAHIVDDDLWTAEQEQREAQQRAEMERADQERRFALEEAARARAEAEEAQRLQTFEAEQEQARRDENEREAAFERRKAEAALERRMQSLSTMQRKLDEKAERLSDDAQAIHHRIGADLDQKFSNLSDALYEKLNGAASNIARLSADMDPQTALSNRTGDGERADLSREIERLRAGTEASLTKLGERIDALSAAQEDIAGGYGEIKRLNALLAERAAPAVAGALQLSELVRGALPADRYEFDRRLESGATADCLIAGHGAARPFAIDARFPVEAYEQYARAEEDERGHMETLYRRAVLRHMVFIAEKLIVPDETADFAIMFLPNDTVFNSLYANFPDIIQDSYRARIWIASPTSLMATMHMMGATAARVATEKRNKPAEADKAIRDDMAALTARLSRLEDEVARVGSSPPAATEPRSSAVPWSEQGVDDNAGETAQPHDEEPTAPAFEEEEAEVQIIGGDEVSSNAETVEENASSDRPPFPLR